MLTATLLFAALLLRGHLQRELAAVLGTGLPQRLQRGDMGCVGGVAAVLPSTLCLKDHALDNVRVQRVTTVSAAGGMGAHDPTAVWVVQAWAFGASFWTNDRLEAYLGGVSNEHMLMLDLVGTRIPRGSFEAHGICYF